MLVVVGIDPGTVNLGYVVLHVHSHRDIEWVKGGVVDLQAGGDHQAVLHALYKCFYMDLDIFSGAHVVVVENQIMGFRGSNPLNVAVMHGIGMLARMRMRHTGPLLFKGSRSKFTPRLKQMFPEVTQKGMPIKRRAAALAQAAISKFAWEEERVLSDVPVARRIHVYDALGLALSVALPVAPEEKQRHLSTANGVLDLEENNSGSFSTTTTCKAPVTRSVSYGSLASPSETPCASSDPTKKATGASTRFSVDPLGASPGSLSGPSSL